MNARQATQQTTRGILRTIAAIALACLVALSGQPAPALAEMAEGAMGTEPAAAQVKGRDEKRDEGDAAGDASLAPMAEEGTADDVPADAELADEGLAAQDAMVPGEPEAAEVPAEEDEPGLSVQSVGQLYSPRVVSRPSMRSGQVATWDCVWLGSYPQTEVPETDALRNAGWVDGDATVGGVRYRRLSRDDALPSEYWGNATYRYFRYEPIKWRILKVNGNTALAVADKALDRRPYHNSWSNITWEASAVRSWLNGIGNAPYYDTGARTGRTAQAFTSVAFTTEQLGAVLQSTIANAANTACGTPGGSATNDRVFLLSESEVHGASATAHGFVSNPDTQDEARECMATDYASMTWSSDCCYWWLRSPGESANCAAFVDGGGGVDRYGDYPYNIAFVVRPALKLNLSSPQLTWAGTVSSDGTVDASARPGSIPPLSDVVPGSWYEGVVSRAVGLGIIGGYANGCFGPNDPITRGQVAVMLWKMAGQPAGGKAFPDVRSGEYYYQAVRWAGAVGVVSGYANGNFGPNDKVTREQLAVMLANYARHKTGRQLSGSAADYASMSDASSVSGWAQSSVGWCCRHGVLNGSNGQLRPQGSASRAEACKMVVGLHDLLG